MSKLARSSCMYIYTLYDEDAYNLKHLWRFVNLF